MKNSEKWFQETFPELEIKRPWSIFPDTAFFLYDLILKNKPGCILELGSGISTAVMARASVSYGGRMYSLEHDEYWLQETEGICGECDIANLQLIHAPLVKGQFVGVGEYICYDPIRIPHKKFDFVLIDGPPGFGEEAPGRKGTLYTIWPFLAQDAVIVLDDADREGERAAVMEWMSALGSCLTVQYLKLKRPGFLIKVEKDPALKLDLLAF